MKQITVETNKSKEVIDITSLIDKVLKKHPAKDGMMHLFLKHSTAALTTAYLAEDLDLDMIGAFEMMLPHTLTDAKGHHTHKMGYLPAHLAASLLGPHLAVPVEGNKVQLGAFQSIVLVELNGPKERVIVVDYNER